MSVRILTSRDIRGPAWAEKYPQKAGNLWVVAHFRSKRKRVEIGPDTPENRAKAERKRDEWEAALRHASTGLGKLVAQHFEDAADAYIKRGLLGRAPKTQDGRRYQAEALKRHFSGLRLDQIGVAEIAAWWDSGIIGSGKDERTGRGYLNALSGIYKHAAKLDERLTNPVPAARARILEGFRNTASARARDEANKHPLSVEALQKLLPKLEAAKNPSLLLTVLLMYEGGLRLGEAIGLRWGDCWFGRDEADTSRHLHIGGSRIGNRKGHTKSGRSRDIAMSLRLRHLLQLRHLAAGRPGPDLFVVEQSWPKNIRGRMQRIYKAAGIEPHALKDFRDTFASLLVSHGIVLKWVSLQLGHANVGITERHYARWMALDGYQNPWQVPPGRLPVDLFAMLDGWIPASATSTPLHATMATIVPGSKGGT